MKSIAFRAYASGCIATFGGITFANVDKILGAILFIIGVGWGVLIALEEERK